MQPPQNVLPSNFSCCKTIQSKPFTTAGVIVGIILTVLGPVLSQYGFLNSMSSNGMLATGVILIAIFGCCKCVNACRSAASADDIKTDALANKYASFTPISQVQMDFLKALSGDDVTKIESLIAAGADVNSRNMQRISQETPLIYAIHLGRLEVVKLLVEKGADLNPQGLSYNIPLVKALLSNNSKIALFLLDLNTGAKIDVNQRMEDGSTALHFVTRFINANGPDPESETLIRLLLDRGADKNIKDTNGRTAFDRLPMPVQNNATLIELLKPTDDQKHS